MPQKLNTYIRRARKRSGLSQRELALLLGKRTGSYVSRFEKGRRVPPLDVAFALAAALNTPVEELFAGRFEKVEIAVKERAEQLTNEAKSKTLARVLAVFKSKEPSNEDTQCKGPLGGPDLSGLRIRRPGGTGAPG